MINGGKKSWKNVYLAFIIFFLYVPFVPLFLFSFNASRSLTAWAGFSWQWYEKMATDSDIALAVINTLFIAILATALSVFIGTLAAIALSRSRKVLRDWLLRINNIPIVNPEIVTAVALLLFFISIGLPTGYFTMLLAHIGFCTPYVIITIYPKLRSLDPNVIEAAQDLGATPWQAIWKVLVPQLKTSIIAAAAIAFTMSFDDFIISYFTAGSVKNISIYLYTTKRRDPSINAFSTVITLIISLVVIGNYLRQRKNEKKERSLLKQHENIF